MDNTGKINQIRQQLRRSRRGANKRRPDVLLSKLCFAQKQAISYFVCQRWRGGDVRPVSNQIRVDSNVAVAMRDGLKLYADVYRPVDAGKFPVLVVRTPYGKQREGIHENLIGFARRGYAVVVQDVRGRFESEGRWDPFRYEAEDGADTVEWAAKQPWSNGRVGMQGGSYLGNVQWQAAAQAPPSLVAIFPAVASTSLYHNTWFHGGAFKLGLAFGWGVARNPRRVMYPQYWHTEKYAPDEWRYENLFWKLPLKTLDEDSAGQTVQHFRDWITHQTYDDYWKAISVEEKFSRVKVPVHVHGGWFDLLLGGTLNGFVGMQKEGGTPKARQETKMIVGPWGHGPSQKFGDVDFGPTANRTLFDRNLQWFDHYLRGDDNGIDREPPSRIFYMGLNRWAHPQRLAAIGDVMYVYTWAPLRIATDYQEWISWTEIASPERIALLHGESHGDPNAFESVLTFAPDGAATRIEMRTVFPTKELRDEAVEKYHTIEGGQQTLSNLAAYVTEIVRKGVED